MRVESTALKPSGIRTGELHACHLRTRPAKPAPRGTRHDSADAALGSDRGGGPGFGGADFPGNSPGAGVQPRVGRPIWPHGLGAVLPLPVRLVSAELLRKRVLPF